MKNKKNIYVEYVVYFWLLSLCCILFEPCKINHRLTNLDHILTPADENVDVTKYTLRV